MSVDERKPEEHLLQLAEDGMTAELEAILDAMPAQDVARAMYLLSDEEQAKVVTAISAEEAADLIEQLSEVQAVDLLGNLSPEDAAEIIDALPSDEQADIISEMNAAGAEAILQRMSVEEAADARALILYPDDVAGGLMIKEYLSYNDEATVGDVAQDLQDNAEKYRDYGVQYAYVSDAGNKLVGVLRMRDLLLTKRSTPLRSIMIPNPRTVRDDTSLDELDAFFDDHKYFGVPVVDGDGAIVGVVQESDVAEATADRQHTDYLKTQGIVGGEEIRSLPLIVRARRRLAWLSVNILLNICAASVIAFYQDTLAAVIALAVFLPIISDMSGCSGNQAVAVSMRELALGLARPGDLLRVWLKEISLGVINGLVLGALVACAAILWKGQPYLGLVVGLALCLNTMVAVSLGGILPLLLKRFKVDPAVASGPILTTVTDMCGFFIVLGFATLLLDKLT